MVSNSVQNALYCFGLVSHLWVLVTSTTNFEEVNSGLSQQFNLSHGILKAGRAMIRGIEFDTNAEVRRNQFSSLIYDVQDELGSLLCGTAVCICAEVCLSWVRNRIRFKIQQTIPLDSRIDLLKSASRKPNVIQKARKKAYQPNTHEPRATQHPKTHYRP